MPNIEGLKQFLQDNINYEEIWFNEEGQWCFSETNGFGIKKTREEVLSAKAEKSADKTNTNSTK